MRRLTPIAAAHACLLLILGASAAAAPHETLIAWADRETVWRANVDGSDVRRLTGGMTADVSPDGTRIAVVRTPLTAASSALYVMNADGGSIRLLRRLGNTNFGLHAPRVEWAPDSRRLAIQDADYDTVLVDTHTGAARTLTHSTERRQVEMGDFAPQGCALAYTVSRAAGLPFLLRVVRCDGTHRRTVAATWSPAVWGRPGLAVRDRRGLRIVALGGGTRLLTKRQLDPIAFSGDGEHLLAGGGSAALYVIDVVTGGVRKITGAPQSFSTARISRDGTMVLATIGCEEPLPPRPLLETIRVADGATNVISGDNAPCRGSWNA